VERIRVASVCKSRAVVCEGYCYFKKAENKVVSQKKLFSDTKSSNVKGEILLHELTSVKETVIDGGSKPNCFALVGSSGFYPFQCASRTEVFVLFVCFCFGYNLSWLCRLRNG
jgi:hypothetical protein